MNTYCRSSGTLSLAPPPSFWGHPDFKTNAVYLKFRMGPLQFLIGSTVKRIFQISLLKLS